MNRTSFISKRAAQSFSFPESKSTRILISITSPSGPDYSKLLAGSPAVLDDNSWKDVLRLEFHDVDHNSNGTLPYKIFSEDDAWKILTFLKKHEDDPSVDDVVVHCEAGVSRSAAVSKFVAHIYNLKFPETYSLYNKLVFSTLLRVYGEALYSDDPIELPGIKEK